MKFFEKIFGKKESAEGKKLTPLEIEQKKREYEKRLNELDVLFKEKELPEKEWKAEIEKLRKIREEIERSKL